MIVVDASVAAKWILAEVHSDKAEALYDACVQRGDPIVAPTLLPFEIANILRQRMTRAGMSLVRAEQLLAQFLQFPVALSSPPGLHERALALAESHGMPATYDAHYLALAAHHCCTLWTDDQRSLRLVGNSLPFVEAIASYPSPQANASTFPVGSGTSPPVKQGAEE